ncbi:hypothetical protein [Streptomyces sp. SPB162]|uniref:hypothetical protein n=1 Tax=Streptomyces sp. SPB162 TaxID=2940560 RepID=UPI00240682F9|nr:hypothetical protein [Streptomyces sp. SPB162]MDF9813184.1 hypothetical protein [Streptomyces sp. SPB162]
MTPLSAPGGGARPTRPPAGLLHPRDEHHQVVVERGGVVVVPAYQPERLTDIVERLGRLERRLAQDGRPDVLEPARRAPELERSFRAGSGPESAG